MSLYRDVLGVQFDQRYLQLLGLSLVVVMDAVDLCLCDVLVCMCM